MIQIGDGDIHGPAIRPERNALFALERAVAVSVKQRHIVSVAIHHRKVDAAVSVQISRSNVERTQAHFVRDWRQETAVAVAQHDHYLSGAARRVRSATAIPSASSLGAG